jgi:hypothetical protein
MDKHVADMMAACAAAATKIKADRSFVSQGRAIAYIGGRVIYAASQQGRYKNVTPYFALQAPPKAKRGAAAKP